MDRRPRPAPPALTAIDVRRAADRFATRLPWLDSRHSFSFGPHYDAGNTHHGVLIANNDDLVQPGAGFAPHRHRDMEIVTWVLEGSLVHRDSAGHSGVIYPGLAQRMSAGAGVLHSETTEQLAHFVQMWVVPDEGGGRPGYAQLDIDDDLRRGGLVPVASGLATHRGDAAIRLRNRHAALYAARLRPGDRVELPHAPYLHLFVARGRAQVEEAGRLETGDAVRFTAGGGQRVAASEPAEVLVWEMYASLSLRR